MEKSNFGRNPLSTDKRSVGSITSQLQDDVARLQAFSGEPIRSMLTAMSAVLIGVTLSFIVRTQRAGSLFSMIFSIDQCSYFAISNLNFFVSLQLLVYVAICTSCDRLYPTYGLCNIHRNEANAW